jgi:hypothetical protein
MDVRDLTPAMLALADLFRLASETLYPGEPPVTLAINATADGSFAVDLSVLHGVTGAITRLFSSDQATASTNLLSYIVGPAGLYALLLARRQKRPEDRQPDGSVRITLPDGTVITFPSETLRLADMSAARTHARSVAAPLEKDGIDSVDFRATPRSAPFVTVRRDDLPALADDVANATDREVLTDAEFEQTLRVVTAAFEPDRSWRFSDGTSPWPARITDAVFLGQIDRRDALFGKNDEIRARVRLLQYREHGVLHTERYIVEVMAHSPASVTGNLLDEIEDAADDDA